MARLSDNMSSLLTPEILNNLHESSVNTVIDFLLEDVSKLMVVSKLSHKDVTQIRHVLIANNGAFPQNGQDLYSHMLSSMALLPTGFNRLDEILNGGLMTGQIVEICGGQAAGKSVFCHFVTANISQQLRQTVVYIDTNGDFTATDIYNILNSKKVTDEDISSSLQRIQVIRSHNMFELLQTLESLVQHKNEESNPLYRNLRMVIVDSVPYVFYPLTGQQWDGIGYLGQLSTIMKQLASEFHIVVLVVNNTKEVNGSPSTSTDATNIPNLNSQLSLGKHWLNVPNIRLFIEKTEETHRIHLVKSTNLPCGAYCDIDLNR